MQIRLMIDDDLDQVTDLWDQHVAEVGGAAFDPDSRMRIFSGLCRCLPAVESVCFVALVDQQIVGFVVGALTGKTTWAVQSGDIEEVYVIPANRRQKIGTELVKQMTEWMRAKGCETIRTRVDTEAPESRAFWKAMGWEGDQIHFPN
ncbi:MAG: GNAT family N-acetyltransferase [Anaerolineae bacterium]